MDSINFELETVIKKFPEHQKHVQSLYYGDVEFRSICEEYYLCVVQLNKFKKEQSLNSEYAEYKRILLELERELEDRIDNKK